MLHETLWEVNIDLTGACLDHPFVRGLGDGTLDEEAFKRYVAQDAFFLRAFARAYAVAGAKCAKPEHMQLFYEFMRGAMDELDTHASYATQLGINLSDVKPYLATRTYVDSLLAHAWHSPPGLTLAAMTPCMRLYAHIGSALAKASPRDNPYQEWINSYSGEEFHELAAEVETLLDDIAEDTPAVRAAYRYAMQCELDFFSAPLGGTE